MKKNYLKFNKQKNNLLKNNIIIKEYKDKKFKKCIVLNLNDCIKYIQNDLKIMLSENKLLSEQFLKDWIISNRILYL